MSSVRSRALSRGTTLAAWASTLLIMEKRGLFAFSEEFESVHFFDVFESVRARHEKKQGIPEKELDFPAE